MAQQAQRQTASAGTDWSREITPLPSGDSSFRRSDGARMDGARSDGARSDGAVRNDARANGARSDGAVRNNARANGTMSDGAMGNSASSNGAAADREDEYALLPPVPRSWSRETLQDIEDHLPNIENNLPDDVVEAPTTMEEVYRGSLRALLVRNVGNYVVATFLIGTQTTVSWEGILYDVGNDYLAIYQSGRDQYIVSDLYSLKYVEFYDTRRRQLCDAMLGEE